MNEYLTAKQVLGKLKQGRVTDISEAYFSQLVRDGVMPNHRLPGKKRKYYLYEEVKKTLTDIHDPSRDPQRKANKRKRDESAAKRFEQEVNELDAKYRSALKIMDLSIDDLQKRTGFSGVVLKELEHDLNECKSINQNLADVLHKQQEFINTLVIGTNETSHIRFGIFKPIVEQMTTEDDFDYLIESCYIDEDAEELES